VRLLVSVRDPAEAAAALAGGAEIIDAKEPAYGAIAPVPRLVLGAIREAVPPELPVSAALGDVAREADLDPGLAGLPPGLSFIKLGFRGIESPSRIGALLTGAVTRVAERLPGVAVIAVAYADHIAAGTPPPAAFPDAIAAAGAAGLLVDTCVKDGRHLFDWLAPSELERMGRALGADGCLLALGGSLRVDHVHTAVATGATILGVRGAACRGGRSGTVSSAQVRRLAERLRVEATALRS
jgi:(5-formylfuran-3-yl)methyl phosphate synthase